MVKGQRIICKRVLTVSYTHLRAHETDSYLVCRLLLEKKFPASACRKKKIACSTNVIKSLREKKGKKYPAHHIARKKNS